MQIVSRSISNPAPRDSTEVEGAKLSALIQDDLLIDGRSTGRDPATDRTNETFLAVVPRIKSSDVNGPEMNEPRNSIPVHGQLTRGCQESYGDWTAIICHGCETSAENSSRIFAALLGSDTISSI